MSNNNNAMPLVDPPQSSGAHQPLYSNNKDEMKGHNPDNSNNNNVEGDENYTCTTLCCPGTISCLLGTLFPCIWCCACVTLKEKQESVLLNWGKFMGTIRRPGIYCINSCGVSENRVSTAINTIDLPNVKTADLNGNPIVLSGIINYKIIDSRKAILDCNDVGTFIKTQGLAVIKRVASQFPYEAKRMIDTVSPTTATTITTPTAASASASSIHSDDHPHNDCLKGENHRVRSMLVSYLQEKVNPCGARIISFDLSDLSYAPEIAQSMLIRQQADAMLEARKVIVAGAVEITHDVLRSLERKGIILEQKEQATLTNNLLVTICGDKAAQPTLSLTAG